MCRPDVRFAAIPLDTQAVLTHRREVGAARDKGHIRPGLVQRGAIGPANAAGADHRDAHISTSKLHCPSPPFRGEREGPDPKGWEGGVGDAAVRSTRVPHLTPTLSAPRAERGKIGRV